MRGVSFVLLGVVLGWPLVVAAQTAAPAPESAAVAFLAKEGPAWHQKFGCYSCHNNGDATRALLVAARHDFDVAKPLSQTLNTQPPEHWKPLAAGDLDGKALSRIAFANALVDAVTATAASREQLWAVTDLLAADQKADGSFRVDPAEAEGLGAPLIPGSPASLGTALATVSARRALIAAGKAEYRPVIERAGIWLRRVPVAAPLDAAAVLLGVADAADATGREQRARALATLRTTQHADGGWGTSQDSDAFRTAVALLALASNRTGDGAFQPSEIKKAIARGRAFLTVAQRPDGTWQESVRPGKPVNS
ncbi:MAG: hypothetical protein ABMA00_22615, partial [Gemmatimonas sp.]